MSRTNVVDAPEDWEIPVYPQHVKEAFSKDFMSHCERERKFPCTLELATLSARPEVRGVKVNATCATVTFKDTIRPPWRWILDQDGKRVAALNDLNKKELLRTKEWPILIRFVSTIKEVIGEDEISRMKRRTRSLEWGRSEEGKRVKRESAERRAGCEPRSYSLPSKGSGRNGNFGLEDSYAYRDGDE